MGPGKMAQLCRTGSRCPNMGQVLGELWGVFHSIISCSQRIKPFFKGHLFPGHPISSSCPFSCYRKSYRWIWRKNVVPLKAEFWTVSLSEMPHTEVHLPLQVSLSSVPTSGFTGLLLFLTCRVPLWDVVYWIRVLYFLHDDNFPSQQLPSA